MSSDRRWPLYNLRPKLHLYVHVPKLGWCSALLGSFLFCDGFVSKLMGNQPGNQWRSNWTLELCGSSIHIVSWLRLKTILRLGLFLFTCGETRWLLISHCRSISFWLGLGTFVYNPYGFWIFMILLKALGFSCWSDEDYIGKICRVARRLNAGTLIATRVITRSLMKYQRYFRTRIGKTWWPWGPGCCATWTGGSSAQKSLVWAQQHGAGWVCGEGWIGAPKIPRALFGETNENSEHSDFTIPRAETFRYRNFCTIGCPW